MGVSTLGTQRFYQDAGLLTDSRALCPGCTGMCPTGALKLVGQEDTRKKFRFAADRCTGCGLYAAFCKVPAIAVNLSLMASKKRVGK